MDSSFRQESKRGETPLKRIRTYTVHVKNLVRKTFTFLARHDVPATWSKTKNEIYPVHLMIALYVLFCLANQS